MKNVFFDLSKRIENKLEKSQSVLINELTSNSAKALTILGLAKNSKVFWITADKRDSLQNYFSAKKRFKKVFCYQDIADEKNIVNLIAQSKTLLNLAKEKTGLFVTDIASFYSSQISKKDLLKKELRLNDKIKISELGKLIYKYGYEKEDKVIIEGDYSIRGEIIDVFTPQFEYPVRVIFDGEAVENIYLFDPSSNKKIKTIESFYLLPITFLTRGQNIFDYFDNNIVVIFDGPEKITSMCQSLNLIDTNFYKLPGLVKKLKNNKKIFLDSLLGVYGSQQKINPGIYKGYQYNGNLNKLKNDLLVLKEDGYRFFYNGKNLNKMNDFLEKINVRLELFGVDLSENIIFKKKKIVILCDAGIFGKHSVFKKKQISNAQKKFINSLTLGDFLVHINHGICRFVSLINLKVESIGRRIEYIVLEFADHDRIYLPLQNISKISKYVGASFENVKLSKLGTSQWLKTKKRVEESTYKIARDILQISAIRLASKGYRFRINQNWEKKLRQSFSFKETDDQSRAIYDVYKDMQKNKTMDRLICGDVGFGKTEVAVRAAALACSNNKQVIVLCPTTILAEQHKATFKERMKNLPVKIESISRFKSQKDQKDILEKASNGLIDILIGTHRLLSSDVRLKNLGLVVVDEEQRFGVKDKEKLKKMRADADVLTLSATPIPRTLYLALGGLKDVSKIQTPPSGRIKIDSKVIDYDEEKIKEIIGKEIRRSGQVFYIYNRVNTIHIKAQKIKELFPGLKVGIAHGQMKTNELAREMADFAAKKIDILVTTKIVENGLDLANANTLIVENAEMFGLAELYQLRGRIGRGDKKAYAYFITNPAKITEQTRERFLALLENSELGRGYLISEKDLELRGGGNVLGKEQSGNIAEVGLGLYSQLLKQAIRKIQQKQHPSL